MLKRKFALYNLGCKVNQYETDAMGELMEKAGYEQVPFSSEAEIFVINTCSVTNMADRKSRQIIHRARKMNPEGIIVACGCYTQTWKKQDADVDIVLGNNRKNDIVSALDRWFSPEREDTDALLFLGENGRTDRKCENKKLKRPGEYRYNLEQAPEYEPLFITKTSGHTRAFIKVQDGCNQFCSYCIIPYARGRIRSRAPQDVLEEIERLADHGFKEVVLTGIHLSSYGKDMKEDGISLMDLIEEIQKVEGIRRIRLGSLEPRVITEEFVERMNKVSKLCHHFHLSLQSGCDRTLKAMNRHYSAKEYEKSCELIRQCWPDAALTTDVIVGFPGETEEDFEASRSFVDGIEFYETHIFKYSRRHGTRADQMPDQVDEEIKTIRSNVLLQLNQKKKHGFLAARLHVPQEVLSEEILKIKGVSYITGHTREYCRVLIPLSEFAGTELHDEALIGRLYRCIPGDILFDMESEEEYLLCQICKI